MLIGGVARIERKGVVDSVVGHAVRQRAGYVHHGQRAAVIDIRRVSQRIKCARRSVLNRGRIRHHAADDRCVVRPCDRPRHRSRRRRGDNAVRNAVADSYCRRRTLGQMLIGGVARIERKGMIDGIVGNTGRQ